MLQRKLRLASRKIRQARRLTLESLEDRRLLATVDVTAVGAAGWFADDMRSAGDINHAVGADLVGTTLTHAGKPGQAATTIDDQAITQQLRIIGNEPAGSTFGGALLVDGTSSNSGKSNVSIIDTAAGFAPASVLPTTFEATYEWYGQPNPTSRTLAFKIGVQSSDWTASQSGFTALRSGESAWDLVLVHVPATSDNAWSTVNVDATTGTWFLYDQASNPYFTPPGGTVGSDKTLADWNADVFWGPKLFGSGAKVTSLQFGLGSSQRQSIAYVDYLQTNILNGGDLIDFGGSNSIYVDDVASDYSITVDADNSSTLTNGDIVTWNPSGTQHPQGSVPYLTFGLNAFLSIQNGVNAANAGGTVFVAAGTHNEDVLVNKSLSVEGAGAGVTTITGPIGGADGATVRVSANNVSVSGFTITRDGNNTTDWNNPGLNFGGVAIQGLAVSGANLHDNIITGNRTGIDINNSGGHTIRNNVITNNHTGLVFRNQTDNLTVDENEITDNRTVGVLFLDASGGTNVPVQQALNSNFRNNDISGNWYGQIVDRQAGGSLPAPGTTNLKNFSGNWLGTASPVITTANSAEPGYAAHIPVIYGGTATAPGGQPDVAGPASANFDITPLLSTGADTNVETTPGRGTFGFQGDYSDLTVTSAGSQTGATPRIQEGIDSTTFNGTVHVAAGTYTGDIDATSKPVTLTLNQTDGSDGIGLVTVDGNVTLNGDDTLALQFTDTTNDHLVVNGTVSLGGATLSATSTAALPPAGYTIITNDLGDAVSGTFAGLPQGATLLLNGAPYAISYTGGTGNDVTLTFAPSSNVYVSGSTLIIAGTGDKDHIDVKEKNGELEVKVRSKTFDFDGTFAGITTIVVYGYAGDDDIKLHKDVTARAFIFGGEGKDKIEGGGGNSVLVGGAGDDDLKGGDGRNVLIGGTGGDKLEGKDGEDILIGGSTDYDNDLAALDAILAQWETNSPYATRVAGLSSTLNTSTVFDDGESDDLKGGKGLDWIFANTDDADKKQRDKVKDLDMGEVLTEI